MSETRKIPIYRPPIMKDAQDALNRCFANGWWGYGSECKKLEQRFVEYKGGWALSTTSCTSSLYIVAKLLFTSKSDEVIVPSITWISTAIVFQMAGFKVRLADVNRNDLMIDIDSIKSAVTKNTKAIVIVHLYGQQCNVEAIREFCDDHNIFMIEDCAHRVDIEENSLSDFSCYSFNTVKEIPCGEGGLIWGRSSRYEKVAQNISYLGMDINTLERSSSAVHKDLVFTNTPGLKMQLHDLGASVANAMFDVFNELKIKRKQIFELYNKKLNNIYGINLLNRNDNDSYLMFVLILEKGNRNKFRDFLAKKGVSTSVHYPSLSCHPLINDSITPVADEMSQKIVTLPCYPDLSIDDQLYIINKIIES
jgi:dTDP-4-amino-4,6-dideoxygalactose transaminase